MSSVHGSQMRNQEITMKKLCLEIRKFARNQKRLAADAKKKQRAERKAEIEAEKAAKAERKAARERKKQQKGEEDEFKKITWDELQSLGAVIVTTA